MVLDLDLFREVNETLGHLAGDRLLVEVARRLSQAAGPDDLVARLGGDEFAALLVGLASPAAAEQRARELLATLDAPIDLDGMRVRVEASAGRRGRLRDSARRGAEDGGGRAAAPGRRRDVPGQAGRSPGGAATTPARDTADVAAADARRRPAPGHRRARVHGEASSRSSTWPAAR